MERAVNRIELGHGQVHDGDDAIMRSMVLVERDRRIGPALSSLIERRLAESIGRASTPKALSVFAFVFCNRFQACCGPNLV